MQRCSASRLVPVLGFLLLLGACADDSQTLDQQQSQVEQDEDEGTDAGSDGLDGDSPPGDEGPASEADAGTAEPSGDGDGGAERDAGVTTPAGSDGGDAGSGAKPTPWKGMRVGTNFWFLGSWAEDAWAANVNFATSSNPWNPQFLADLEQANYAVYRFMDFAGTNNSSIRTWSERTQQTSAQNASGGDVGGRGIAYEWMFDLCNRMHKDCWITVPHLAIESYEQNANDNYFTELAKLAKQKLDPGLTLYLEYSNETWNPGFQQATYSQTRGTAMKLATDAYGASFKFHVYASSRLYDAFVKVYGQEIARVRWVVSGQLSSDYGTELQVDALKDPKINFGQRTPDDYAISNYVGADGSINGSASNVSAQFVDGIAAMVKSATSQKALSEGAGMRLISYEGGQHITQGAAAFSKNPAAYELYEQWLDASAKLYALTVHYALSGSYSDGGAWGAKEHVGQPLSEAPKARALVDWIKAHP
jgi:hypothetical protein